MANEQYWQLTNRERRQAFTAAVAAFSTVLGPLGPLAVWGLEYIYDRRNLIFSPAGAPVGAYTADRSMLSLSTLSNNAIQPPFTQSALSIDISLTDSARKLGLRIGDPVSIMLTGHRYLHSRSGLVVLARIGERVNLTVPSGSYSVAAFGSKRENLFSQQDPYSTVSGDNIAAHGRQQFTLPLTARMVPASVPTRAAGLAWQKLGTLSSGACLWCGLALTSTPLNHTLSCPQRPARITQLPPSPHTTSKILPLPANLQPPRQTSFWCDRCYGMYPTRTELDEHMRNMHPFIHWVRSWLD